MKRKFEDLSKGPFDLLIIGGGIYGAWTAYDASLRGLRTALVEKGDWASGTSSVSSKLIHGGLRYLEHLKFNLVRTALAERRLLADICPHRVRPLLLAAPLFQGSRVSPFQMKMGLTMYDFLAGQDQPVPPHKFYNRKKFIREYPFFNRNTIRAGFTYGDCITDDSRLVLEVMEGALHAGSAAVNYARADSLLRDGKTVAGALVEDRESGKTVEVRARLTVNAAGAWNEGLLGTSSEKQYTIHTKGIHLVMPPLSTDSAFLVMTERDNRIFFILPWYGKTLLGTTDTVYEEDPDNVSVNDEDIDYLLGEAGRVLQGVNWNRSDIHGTFAGLRSMARMDAKSPSSVSREWSLEKPEPGLLLPIGGKLTSARADAQVITDEACRILNKGLDRGRPTETTPLPWSPGAGHTEWKEHIADKTAGLGIDKGTAEWSAFRYGTSINEVLKLVQDNPELAKPIIPGLPFFKAELIHCAKREMTVHLEDLVRRRLPLALLERLSGEAIREIAEMVSPTMCWTEADKQREVQDVVGKWCPL